MRFFGREKEISRLLEIRESARESAQFTVIQGRRRIGKTELLLHAFSKEQILYLFVTRSSETALCREFQSRIESFFHEELPGQANRFSELFRYLLRRSASETFTVVIDEFQDFYRVNNGIFSEMQRDWDELHGSSHINLIVCGSIYTMMNRIFREEKEPLFGRQTAQLNLRAFDLGTLKAILEEYHPSWKNEDLLALWTFTGGVAKYVSLLMDRKAWSLKTMLGVIIEEDSYFLQEGWAVLREEFGNDCGVYFSILAAIASGQTSRAEIMNLVGGEVGGYLTRLEEQYHLVAKKQPFGEPTANKNCLYMIEDNFFRFWFRFIFKYQYLLQVRMFDELREVVMRDYPIFSGQTLEAFFREDFIEGHRYTRLGAWWNRKSENEIDLVCDNEFNNTLDFYEIKRDVRRFSQKALQEKAEAFLKKHPEYRSRKMTFQGLSLGDIHGKS